MGRLEMRGFLHLLPAIALCLVGALPAIAADPRPATSPLRLQLWFSNDRLNPDPMDCRAVFAVERRVPMTRGVAAATLRALFAGPTPEESVAGFRSVFSPASAGLLKGVFIRNGTAYVDLHDLGEVLSGATSSCGAAEFQAQVSRSLQRYPSVERVIFAFEGQPRRFYEWMNESCGPRNDDCDPRPFGARR
jgi:Sporulation and spore germination